MYSKQKFFKQLMKLIDTELDTFYYDEDDFERFEHDFFHPEKVEDGSPELVIKKFVSDEQHPLHSVLWFYLTDEDIADIEVEYSSSGYFLEDLESFCDKFVELRDNFDEKQCEKKQMIGGFARTKIEMLEEQSEPPHQKPEPEKWVLKNGYLSPRPKSEKFQAAEKMAGQLGVSQIVFDNDVWTL